MLFSQKTNELKVGEFVTTGTPDANDKFVQSKYGARVVVSKITKEETGDTRIDLAWSGGSKSYVYLHDEGKYWVRVSKFN